MADEQPGTDPANEAPRRTAWRDRVHAMGIRARASRIRARAGTAVRTCAAWVRCHPWHALAIPPLLILAWVLALIPFTPGIGDLRKFRSEVPAVVLSSDGIVRAE